LPAQLTLTAISALPTVRPGDDLAGLICAALANTGEHFQPGDILVLAQKIISKAEGRCVSLDTVIPSPRALALAPEVSKDPRLVELVLRESAEVLRQVSGVLIVVHRLGFILANAGIDASNVEAESGGEHVLLLPENPDASAATIRAAIRERTGTDIAVLIIDSFGRAWRMGTIGTAIGVSGMPGLLDLRGRPDRTGRPLRVSELGVADEVAAAASLLMGQADEGQPAVLLRGFPYRLREGVAAELVRPKHMDLFR
jgi:coenzyme F420-0:L-glutamate ligase/coenzyme F420-1:gamma-L-glutamate ligase